MMFNWQEDEKIDNRPMLWKTSYLIDSVYEAYKEFDMPKIPSSCPQFLWNTVLSVASGTDYTHQGHPIDHNMKKTWLPIEYPIHQCLDPPACDLPFPEQFAREFRRHEP
jgi:hypothetical protein